MTHESLPSRADLDQLRRKAKELFSAAAAGDPSALGRIHVVSDRIMLASAQLVIARDHGFRDWTQLVAAVRAGPARRPGPRSVGSDLPDPAQRREAAGSWLVVRYPDDDDEHYRVQVQQLPIAGGLPGLTLFSTALRAHTVDEVYDLAAELGIARDLVCWLGPHATDMEGPWPVADPDVALELDPYDDAPDPPTPEQQARNGERIEAATALVGRIARGQIQTAE